MFSSSNDTSSMSFDEYIAHLYVPFEEIQSEINNFGDENLLKEGTSFKVYKGQVLESGELINIVVRKCLQPNIVLNELRIVKNLKHFNIASPFKFTRKENKEVVVINKHEANESLEKHLGGPSLTWMQRLHICVRVAKALKYLHYDVEDTHHVIHGNIKSSKILLDRNWEPKLHGFAFAVRAKKHRLHLTSKYNGSLQYMDPAYENTRGLTHKSHVFSFGVLLFEVLFGKEASISNNDNWYFARLARSHYEDRKLYDFIDPCLRQPMNVESFNVFAETAYCCLKEKRSERPNMNQILSRLEGALELQQKLEHSTTAVEGTSSNYHLKGKNLDHLKFRLSDIELATNKFSRTYCIGSGGYGMVYKAELDHFDGLNSLAVEGKIKGELSKKRSTVAIKRIFSRVDKQGERGFFAEIETLSSCKHPNIISLLGFCDEGPEMLLVYEYASNGSLDDSLGNIDNMINLTWAQRIQICLDIAHGLNYLHKSIEDKQIIIHRDIKSANILLDDNWVAKIADFGLSRSHNECQQGSTLITYNIAGTEVYLDPEYLNTGKLKTKSDIYSFGVVMFEIMCGKLAYDKTYNEEGLPPIARQCFIDGTLEKLVDPKIKETDENISMLNGGVSQDSLDTFSKIAYQCSAKTQSERPTMEVIIKELEKALNFQKNCKDNLYISLKAIKLATQNFNDCNCIGGGRFWKLYEGELAYDDGRTTVLVKRWDATSLEGHIQFLTEHEVLLKYKHKNIIGLVGYCNEMNEKIIVYEHASKGRLDKHLADPSLTWTKRLKICIDVAIGLKFLHIGGGEHEDSLMHRDIKSGSILLDGDWSAKISNLEFSCNRMVLDKAEHVDHNSESLGYVDPLYHNDGFLTGSSDVYSLGVILLEVLCGRLAWVEGCEDQSSQSLGPLALSHYNEKGNLDELIFDGIKEQIMPQSLTTFQEIAIKCLQNDRCSRPWKSEEIKQLKKAMEFQEDYDIWEPKLPIDYKKIIQMSKNPKIYDSIEMKKNLYNMFSKGILLQDSKVWFSLGSNGERNEMISAKKFSYKNHLLRKWRSLPESRFPKVVEMFDISDLKIQTKIRTLFLSPRVYYKVHLIFRFRGPRKSQPKRMYVNLKYKMGNESLHAYFATRRKDGWMMIELFWFLSHNKDTDFEVLLESFSRCYCGNDSIYIEGILFQAIDNVKHEETEKLKEVQQVMKSKSKRDKFLFSPSNMKVKKDHMTWFSLSRLKSKKDGMISAEKVLFQSSHVAIQSRFDGAIELQKQQVLHIKCKIKSQILSSHTENVCFLVFKLSEKCHGLHGPVIVRDMFRWRSKDARILYFRYPNPWNVCDTDWVPKKRKDGWMEVIVWKFNSNYELKNDHIFVNLKLITYEGTMSGLMVRGIKFRPV